MVHVQNPLSGENIPWIEGFENTSFPNHPTDATKNWEITGDGSSQWFRLAGVSTSGQACAVIENMNNTTGQISTMLSPSLLLAGNNPGSKIKFKVAYAQKNENSTDKLNVFLSDNCGLTWSLRYNRSGPTLSTNGGVYVSSFTPNSLEWRQESITLSTFQNKPYLRIKFVATSGDGNEIYIDDINFDQATSIDDLSLAEKIDLAIYPNPVNDETTINFTLTNRSEVSFILTDLVGKQIAQYSAPLNEGDYNFPINDLFKSCFDSGLYFIKVTVNGQSVTNKIIKE
jgi:hypothetical protein